MRTRAFLRALATFAATTSALLATAAGCKSERHTDATRLVEFRSYSLKPGTRAAFDRRFVEQSLPMLERWHIDAVAYGPSPHDDDSWFLIRSYPSLADRQQSEDAFYGSDEWRKGPREAVLADIDSYTTFVLELDEATLAGIREAGRKQRIATERAVKGVDDARTSTTRTDR